MHNRSKILQVSNLSFRIVGFLLGFSLASSFAAYHLLEEYKQASAALQTSVLELQASTEKASNDMSSILLKHINMNGRCQVTTHIRRIEAVEKDLKALTDVSVTKDDLSRVRAEMKKVYDGLNIGVSIYHAIRSFVLTPLLQSY